MTVNQMRMAIAEAYPNLKWKDKCETMPDNQVIAIYKRIMNGPTRKVPSEQYKQLDIFDVWGKEVLNGVS